MINLEHHKTLNRCDWLMDTQDGLIAQKPNHVSWNDIIHMAPLHITLMCSWVMPLSVDFPGVLPSFLLLQQILEIMFQRRRWKICWTTHYHSKQANWFFFFKNYICQMEMCLCVLNDILRWLVWCLHEQETITAEPSDRRPIKNASNTRKFRHISFSLKRRIFFIKAAAAGVTDVSSINLPKSTNPLWTWLSPKALY